MLYSCCMFTFRSFHSEFRSEPLIGFVCLSRWMVDSCLFAVFATQGWNFQTSFLRFRMEALRARTWKNCAAGVGLLINCIKGRENRISIVLSPACWVVMYCTHWRLGCLIGGRGNNRILVVPALRSEIYSLWLPCYSTLRCFLLSSVFSIQALHQVQDGFPPQRCNRFGVRRMTLSAPYRATQGFP